MEANEEAALSPGTNQSLGGTKSVKNPMTWQKLLNHLFKGANLGPTPTHQSPTPTPTAKEERVDKCPRLFRVTNRIEDSTK